MGIDEGQFFDIGLVQVAGELANEGKRVVIAGLDQDYRGKPFEPMPQLLAVAEYITKTLAICVVCGNPADRTQRTTPSQGAGICGCHGCIRGAMPEVLRSSRSGMRMGDSSEGLEKSLEFIQPGLHIVLR